MFSQPNKVSLIELKSQLKFFTWKINVKISPDIFTSTRIFLKRQGGDDNCLSLKRHDLVLKIALLLEPNFIHRARDCKSFWLNRFLFLCLVVLNYQLKL